MPITERVRDAQGLAPGNGYAHAVVTTGRLAFVAGQVALDENGDLVGEGDLRAQIRQTLGNLGRVLDALGVGWDAIARLNWYVRDASEILTIREERDAVLRPALGELLNPASTLIEVPKLARPGFLVEIDAVVSLPDAS